MNILFLFNKPIIPEKGGVQRVTDTLATHLKKHGMTSYFISPLFPESLEEVDKNQLYLPTGEMDTTEDKVFFQEVVEKYKIQVVINQMSYSKNAVGLLACVPHIKRISVFHISPYSNWKYFFDSQVTSFPTGSGLHRLGRFSLLNQLGRSVFRLLFAKKFRNTSEHSDRLVFFTPSYVADFEAIAGVSATEKSTSLANPIPFVAEKKSSLEKRVLYIGRLAINQKRIDLLLDAWELIMNTYPDWHLDIVGSGPDEQMLKAYCEKKQLKRVAFHGQQTPQAYYEQASILALPSAYEGFPMAMVESMSYGLVPVAFDSYAALKELVGDHNNGLLASPFDVKAYAGQLSMLMGNPDEIKIMAKRCVARSAAFEVSLITQQWADLLSGKDESGV